MMLKEKIVKGIQKKPHCLLIHGVNGVGKTYFATKAPDPIFIDGEDGTAKYNISRLQPKTWQSFNEDIDLLIKETHDYKTVVIDSLDWYEQILFKKLCTDSKVSTISRAYGGYGGGYKAAVEHWEIIRNKLIKLRDEKNMNVILIAHSIIEEFIDPTNQINYHKYIVNMDKRTAPVMKNWVEVILFANFEIMAVENENTKPKAISDGSRMIYTEYRPAFDAKNRLDLPLSFSFENGYKDFTANIGLRKKITPEEVIELADTIKNSDKKKQVIDFINNNKNDMIKLNMLKNRIDEIKENEK